MSGPSQAKLIAPPVTQPVPGEPVRRAGRWPERGQWAAEAEARPGPGDDLPGAAVGHDFARVDVHPGLSVRVQARLVVGRPGDRYEDEAERAADAVVGRSVADRPPALAAESADSLRRQPVKEDDQEREKEDEEESETVQTRALPDQAPRVTLELESQIAGATAEGSPLPADQRAFYEQRFGHDFGAVRVHTGPRSAAAAQAVGAQAFTRGQDVYFGAGYYRPESGGGQRLMAHELAHTIQQRSNVIVRQPLAALVATADPLAVSEAHVPTGRDGHPAATDGFPKAPGDKAEQAGGMGEPDKAREPREPDKAAGETEGEADVQDKVKNAAKGSQAAVAGSEAEAEPGDKAAATGKEGEATAEEKPSELAGVSTGDLALIDKELAEHQRWGQAGARVGAAGSAERAKFIAEAAGGGSGFTEGLLQGAKFGAGIKIGEKLVEKGAIKIAAKAAARFGTQAAKFTPLPAVGAVVGGVLSAYELASRDWKATGEAIGRFGKGASIYDTLANSIESVSTVIDVATQVLNVIAGVIGAISIAMWVITVLTVGIASPLAATLSAIAAGIGIGTMVLDGINALVLKQLITLFRSLHAFTSEADPRDVVVQGNAIGQAACAVTGFVGGFAGGVAGGGLVERGGKALSSKKPSAPVPDHPTPSAASGEGPTVKAELPVESSTSVPDQPTTPAKPDAPIAAAQPLVESQTKPSMSGEPPIETQPSGKDTAVTPETGTTAPKEPAASAFKEGTQPTVPEEGHIVWGAMEQLGEKFAMDAGVAPGDRIRLQRKAETLKRNFEKEMQAAGFEPYEAGKEVSNTKWRPVEGKANPKRAQTARAKYQRESAKVADERVSLQRKARESLFKAEASEHPISSGLDVDEAFAKDFGDVLNFSPEGPGAPLSAPPSKPHRVLPLKEPPRVTKPGEGTAQAGLVGRHEHQPPRGDKLISEHITPGAQWEAVTKGKTGPIYGESQYGYDVTMLFGKEEAAIKTHEGPTADNARTRAIKAKIAKGERVDIIEDLVLLSIDETVRARDIAQQRRAAQAQTQAHPASAAAAPLESKPAPAAETSAQPASVSLTTVAVKPGTPTPGQQPGAMETAIPPPTSQPASALGGMGLGSVSHLPPAAAAGARVENQSEPIVEHVNPNYSAPPCTPQQIVDVQNQILETLDARAQAEAVSAAMGRQTAKHKANEKPLAEMGERTAEANSATEAHQQAVTRRAEANKSQEEKEGQVAGKLSDYSSQAAKLATITVPMRAFERFTSLAYSLPDSPEVLVGAKRGILKMNADSKRFLNHLDSIDQTVNAQKAGQADRNKQIQANADTLTQTDSKAKDSNQSFNKAKQTTEELENENKTRLDEATKLHTEANQHVRTLENQEQQKRAEADSLTSALQAWAQNHRQARLDALEQTKTSLEQQGYRVTEVKEF